MELENHIHDLIIANATGNISAEDKKLLLEWKLESESNLKEYNRLTALCKRTNLTLHWDGIDENIAHLSFKNKVSKGRVFPVWLRVAASFIIILSLSVLFVYQDNILNKEVKVAEILPGKSKAVLILSDGSTVALGNEDIQLTEKLVGENISGKALGKITYDKSSDVSKANVKYNTIKVPRGGEYQLVLSDGTKVWLNSETTLKYPVVFTGNTREVQLVGEAFFKVAHNKNIPFFVNSEVTKVKVLGTSFNYKSYRGEDITEVTLAEGKVNVEVGNNQYTLEPGKQARINRSNKEADVIDVEVEHYISWRDGVFQFVNMPMEELTVCLSRWYKVEFKFAYEGLKYERFSGAVTKYRDINYILGLIEETNDIKFDVKGNYILIK